MLERLDGAGRADTSLLVAFTDLTRYAARAASTPDLSLAETMDEYYHRVHAVVDAAGGRVVKFIGDGVLLVFPEDRVDEGVSALLELKREIDAWLHSIGWDSRLIVRAHFGSAIAGRFGPPAAPAFDVIGSTVNIAATVASQSFAMTAELFRKLSPDLRKAFKKHTPPITYIRVEDPHPYRTGRRS